MTGAAIIRVRRPSGALATFHASHVDLRDGLITATGRWRDCDRVRADTWPRGRVVEVIWTELDEAMAA
jgi:hypothetical protein